MSFAIKFSHFCRRISHEFFASVHPLSAMHFLHSYMLFYTAFHIRHVFPSTALFTYCPARLKEDRPDRPLQLYKSYYSPDQELAMRYTSVVI
jgi:hypothetical protein